MSNTHYFLLASGYAEADQPGLHGFYLLADSGALVPNGSWAGVANPAFLASHPQGGVYAASETNDGAVVALRLGMRPGEVRVLGQQPSGGDAPCHLTFDPTGAWLAVANYSSGTARLIPRLPDGSLGAPGPITRHSRHGPNPERQTGPHAHATIFSSDGRFAIVADLGLDRLMIYTPDGTTGALQAHGEGVAHPGAGPRHMVWHPGGQLLYVANELDATVSSFSFDPQAGTLVEREQLTTLPPGNHHKQVADIQIDAAGARLYVSNRGHNSVAVFTLAPDGALSPLAIRPCGGDWPRNLALSPDGKFLLVANQHSGELAVLPILPGPDALGEPVARAAVPGAACVRFMPEGLGWTL